MTQQGNINSVRRFRRQSIPNEYDYLVNMAAISKGDLIKTDLHLGTAVDTFASMIYYTLGMANRTLGVEDKLVST